MSSTSLTSVGSATRTASGVVPPGALKMLSVDDIKRSTTNPRLLFDKLPLGALRDNIRINGVLANCSSPAVGAQGTYPLNRFQTPFGHASGLANPILKLVSGIAAIGSCFALRYPENGLHIERGGNTLELICRHH